MSFAIHRLQTAMPIAARSLSLKEWLVIASATRMVTGVARIWVNRPNVQCNPPLTREQRYKRFLERCFIEGLGTPLHVLSLYWAPEPISKFLERSRFLKLPTAHNVNIEGIVSTAEITKWQEAITKAIQHVYDPTNQGYSKNIVANRIFNGYKNHLNIIEVKQQVAKAMGHTGIDKLPKGVTKVLNELLIENLQRRLTVASVLTVTTGILTSAFLTGYVMQWANDNVISKWIVPKILRATKISPAKEPKPIQDKLPPVQERTFWM